LPANSSPATRGRRRSASDLYSRHGNLPARCRHAALAALAYFGAVTLAAAAQPFAERVATCLACHGEQGQSSLPEVPSLGGQPAPYVLIQLYLFRGRQRLVEVMNEASKDLSDDDLRTFSDFIAKLPPSRPAAGDTDPARIDRGQALVRQYRCDFCHNPDLAGRENVPRLAGQREDYLIKAMREYKSNTRPGYDASMADVLARISDAEMLDLAYFAARQP
jgi:cytochrome c553